MSLQVLNFPQGGDEWENFRRSKLTASKFSDVFCGGEVTMIKLIKEVPDSEIRSNAVRMQEVLNQLRGGNKLKSELNDSGLNGLKKKGCIEESKVMNLRLSSSHDSHINRMICENLFSGEELGDWSGSYATDRGHELEPVAAEEFARIMGKELLEVGCVRDLDFSHDVSISPDRLVEYSRNSEGFINQIDEGLEIKCPYPQNHLGYLRKGVLPNEYVQQVHGSMAITGASAWWFMSYCPKLQPLIIKVTRNGYTEQIRGVIKQYLARYDDVLLEVKNIGREVA